jgi:hypothetical protein
MSSVAREYEQVYEHYVRQQADEEWWDAENVRKRHRKQPELASMDWDPIDDNLAGHLKATPLRKWAEREKIVWMSPLEQLAPGFTPATVEDAATKKTTQVKVASWVSGGKIAQLKGTLLRKAADVARYFGAPCGLFGVPKPLKNVLRVIFDARPANELLAPRPEQLVLFSLMMLVWGLATFPHVTTVDYRHYYYQFSLPLRLAWFFFITVDGEQWLPRVLPMGFREAVTIAQCATWAVVLYREGKDSALGVDMDALRSLPAMPPYVSLKQKGVEVGRIFVLLDGVCVACKDDALRAEWESRLRRNEDHFHVVRKETADANLRVPGARVEFAGVVFTSEGWSPTAEIPDPVEVAPKEVARKLASRLGRVLWALRVYGALDPGREGPLQQGTLMSCTASSEWRPRAAGTSLSSFRQNTETA